MSFNPHCRTLVNRMGRPVSLQAVLPDGTFLFRQSDTSVLTIVDAEGRSVDNGKQLLRDATQPKPERVPVFMRKVGDSVVYANMTRNPILVSYGTIIGRKSKAWIVRLHNGEEVIAPHFMLFNSAEDVRLRARFLLEFLSNETAKTTRETAAPRRRLVDAHHVGKEL